MALCCWGEQVERALVESEEMEAELEDERDVLKALQVRLVLEDVAQGLLMKRRARHLPTTAPQSDLKNSAVGAAGAAGAGGRRAVRAARHHGG
jgi:hypothetical protein